MAYRSRSPSTSTSSKRKKSSRLQDDEVETLFKNEVPISESFLEHQQVKMRDKSTTDVHLICSNGFIPVHAVIMQSVSPFFEKMFSAQGDYYFGNRPVIMLDWSLEEVSKMVEFIYTGTTTVTRREQENLKTMLEFFRIHIAPGDFKIEKRNSNLRTLPKTQILLFRGKQVEEIDLDPSEKPINGKETVRRKHRAEEEDADDTKVHKRAKVHETGEVDLDMADIEEIPVTTQGRSDSNSSSSTSSKTTHTVVVACKTKPGPASRKKSTQRSSRKEVNDPNRVSSTDTSDGEIDFVETKNSDWFMKEACRCQRCNKTYPNPAEASTCLTNNHNRLRCYLCFKVVRTTAKLFLHFSKRHRQGAREQTLICGWCDQTIPFKSVSCHVISLHLTGIIAPNQRLRRPLPAPRTYRSDAVGRSTLPAVSKVPEKRRRDLTAMTIKNGTPPDTNGDVETRLATSEKQTIRFRSICGQTRVFVVKLK